MNERLEALRRLMQEKNIAVYIVPTADFHESEYVGAYFACRRYLTGFTGSAGIAAVTQDSVFAVHIGDGASGATGVQVAVI